MWLSAQYNCRAKYTHIGWNETNIFKLLLVSCFHIHQAYTITLTRYRHYNIRTKLKLLSHFLTPMSIVLINIAVNQYDATLSIIISCFSRRIYFDGDIWKKNSVRLFRRRFWSALAIMYFSVMHKSQRLVPHL